MPALSRITDLGQGICCCHPTCISMTGCLITGAQSHYSEGQSVSRIGDIMLGFCGHIGVMITGAGTSSSQGSPVVRIGDVFVGCFTGVNITGASSHYVE